MSVLLILCSCNSHALWYLWGCWAGAAELGLENARKLSSVGRNAPFAGMWLCLHCVLMDDGEQCSGLLWCNELSLGGQICCKPLKDILGDPLHLFHYSAATNHYFHYWFGLKNVNKVEKLLIKVPRSTRRRLQIVSFIQQAVKSLKDSSFAVICGMEKQLIAHLKTQKMTHAALPVAGVVSDRTPKPPFIKY